MKVYYEVLPDTLGRVMHRINKEFKKYAPKEIVFVSSAKEANLQILDSIGVGSIPHIKLNNYVLLQHCYITTETPAAEFWIPHWQKAKLVSSYMDLPALIGRKDFNFLQIPVGVDSSIFYQEHTNKVYQVMSTGYVAETECIAETLKAVKHNGGKMAHVGGDLFPNDKTCKHFENITDDEMRSLYNQSCYTIGMRRMEGFEVPLIEGTLCGARGITLDYYTYRYWFGDLMEYIQDGPPEYITEQLIKLMSVPYRVVTQEEINLVKEKFAWKRIAETFWNRVREVV